MSDNRTGITDELIAATAAEQELAQWVDQVKEAIFYMRVAARTKGYALATHGTLRRDIDVVAVPWTDEASSAEELARYITDALVNAEMSYSTAWEVAGPSRENKPLGRIGFSIPLKWKWHTGHAPYIDLSIAPRLSGEAAQAVAPPKDEPDEATIWAWVDRLRRAAGDCAIQFGLATGDMHLRRIAQEQERTYDAIASYLRAKVGSRDDFESSPAAPATPTLLDQPTPTAYWLKNQLTLDGGFTGACSLGGNHALNGPSVTCIVQFERALPGSTGADAIAAGGADTGRLAGTLAMTEEA